MRARRPGFCATCLASFFKLFNFLHAFVGVSLVVYSLLVLHRFHRDFLFDLPLPWFACFLMGLGLTMCLIALVGYFAAEGYIGCCLCSHAMLATLFIFLEAFMVGYLMLDRQWEKDLPGDVTGELGKLRAFIETNFEFCKWIGLSLVVIQAILGFLISFCSDRFLSTRSEQYLTDILLLHGTRATDPSAHEFFLVSQSLFFVFFAKNLSRKTQICKPRLQIWSYFYQIFPKKRFHIQILAIFELHAPIYQA